jgi:hypothetical protein
MQAEQLSKLRGEIRRERDATAALRAEWAKLVSPARIEDLAQRHLPMKPAEATQVDNLDNLPERKKPQPLEPFDPIAALIGDNDAVPTGSVTERGGQ